jgi:anti-anti-sigma factor
VAGRYGLHTMLVHSSSGQHRAHLGAWVAEAIGRGDKVLYTHAPSEDAASAVGRCLSEAGLDSGPLASGQLELIDAERMRALSGGEHETLLELHVDLVAKARRDGYAGVAMTADGPALRVLTRDEAELLAHERDLDRLTSRFPVRALCRYHVREKNELLTDVLGVHFRSVEDVIWSADACRDRLWVHGELDAGNVDRFAEVLRAALRHGVATVDLSGLSFLSAAGARVVMAGADLANDGGAGLVLANPAPGPARVLGLLGLAEHAGIKVIHEGGADDRA